MSTRYLDSLVINPWDLESGIQCTVKSRPLATRDLNFIGEHWKSVCDGYKIDEVSPDNLEAKFVELKATADV